MVGKFYNGRWNTKDTFGHIEKGVFVRPRTRIRHWVRQDGQGDFLAEPNRYHIFFSYACPWAHRTIIFLALKKLKNVISASPVQSVLSSYSWSFSVTEPEFQDPLEHHQYLGEFYLATDRHYTGRVTVPVLWDKKNKVIVNNESSEIIRMLNSEFNQFTDATLDLCPADLRDEIDKINSYIYDNINNGVYQCGFAEEQHAYEAAFDKLFQALDFVDSLLAKSDYLVGGRLTEADIRLFTTLIRFDAVYYSHFKCNLKRIIDYSNLFPYMLRIYRLPGVKETVKIEEIKKHYFCSHPKINPLGIVPKGPSLDWL